MGAEQGKIMQQRAQGDSTFELYGLQQTYKRSILSAKLWQVYLQVEGITTVHIYARPFLERVAIHLCARSVVVSWLCRVVQEL